MAFEVPFFPLFLDAAKKRRQYKEVHHFQRRKTEVHYLVQPAYIQQKL
jgi:hypothetical protein